MVGEVEEFEWLTKKSKSTSAVFMSFTSSGGSILTTGSHWKPKALASIMVFVVEQNTFLGFAKTHKNCKKSKNLNLNSFVYKTQAEKA